MKDEVYSLHQELEDLHWWFVGRRRVIFPLIQKIMNETPADLIVDVGCGTGGTVAALSKDYKCLGVDLSEQAIRIAKQKYPNCDFICGEVPKVLLDTSAQTALYTLMDVLEHVEEDKAFLANVVALMKPGSNLLITVPAKPVLWSEHDVAAGHVRRYEEHTLTALWKDLPLSPRVFSYFNTRLYPAIWTARVLLKKLGLFTSKGGSDLSMPPTFINQTLTEIFASEKYHISNLLHDPSAKPYSTGVSFVALLQHTG